jgi:CRP-like cAMP-binding protein
VLEPSALKDAYLVAGLTEDQVKQVAALATVRDFSSTRPIVQLGEPANEVFVILSGHVLYTTHDGDTLGEAGPNSVVGEMGLVDAMPHDAHVTCRGSVVAAVFNTADLRKLMRQNRDWGFVMLCNVARVLSARLRQSDARIDELCDQATPAWEHAL